MISQDSSSKTVNLLSKAAPFSRPIMIPPCGTERQLERSRSRTSPQDEPSQSFLCRSSLVAFPSLPGEKEYLQPEGGVNLDEFSRLRGSLLHDIPHPRQLWRTIPQIRDQDHTRRMGCIK